MLSPKQRAEHELQFTIKFNSILSLSLINDTKYYHRKVLAQKVGTWRARTAQAKKKHDGNLLLSFTQPYSNWKLQYSQNSGNLPFINAGMHESVFCKGAHILTTIQPLAVHNIRYNIKGKKIFQIQARKKKAKVLEVNATVTSHQPNPEPTRERGSKEGRR